VNTVARMKRRRPERFFFVALDGAGGKVSDTCG
jgi:hypothetical protein